ncbi:hypothetical protein LXL04_009472 [Taraxacum kok-saghyz]
MKVENFQFPAVGDLSWDLVNKMVVWQGKLFKLRELSNCRRDRASQAARLEDNTGYSENIRVVGDPPLTEYSGGVTNVDESEEREDREVASGGHCRWSPEACQKCPTASNRLPSSGVEGTTPFHGPRPILVLGVRSSIQTPTFQKVLKLLSVLKLIQLVCQCQPTTLN